MSVDETIGLGLALLSALRAGYQYRSGRTWRFLESCVFVMAWSWVARGGEPFWRLL